VVFYAEPIDKKAIPKLNADFESLGAKWVTIEEFDKFTHKRSNYLLTYAK